MGLSVLHLSPPGAEGFVAYLAFYLLLDPVVLRNEHNITEKVKDSSLLEAGAAEVEDYWKSSLYFLLC
jgi:hypothetical protein